MGGRGIPREGPDHLWDSNPKLGVPQRGSSLPANKFLDVLEIIGAALTGEFTL